MPPPHVIALDDEATWPPGVCALLDDHLHVLRSYESERARIEQLRDDPTTRHRPRPSNPHAAAREQVSLDVQALVEDAFLIGYHCTRLHDDEITSIRTQGLRPLSSQLAQERVLRRLAAGDLTGPVADRLLAHSRADDALLPERRTGMTWLIFTTAPLRQEDLVWRLFTFWGGEALYISHEDDDEISPILRALGTACIVEAMVPIKAVDTYVPMGERIVRRYLHHRGIDTGHDPEVEGSVRTAIPGEAVRRVARRSDCDFEGLTECSRWQEAPT